MLWGYVIQNTYCNLEFMIVRVCVLMIVHKSMIARDLMCVCVCVNNCFHVEYNNLVYKVPNGVSM